MNKPASSPRQKLDFDNWIIREYQTDPVVAYTGMTSCERPEYAMALFTTRSGRELEAANTDLIKLNERLKERIYSRYGQATPSPALKEAVERQLEIVGEALEAMNERRNTGIVALKPETPAVITKESSAADAAMLMQRLGRDSKATAEQRLHQVEDARLYVDGFLRTMIDRASEARQKQLASLAKARAAKAARRAGKSDGPS